MAVKAIQALSEVEVAQGLNDLRATGLPIGLLVTFGKAKLESRRLRMGQGQGKEGLEPEVKDVE